VLAAGGRHPAAPARPRRRGGAHVVAAAGGLRSPVSLLVLARLAGVRWRDRDLRAHAVEAEAVVSDQSGLAAENFTTLAHFSVSSATYFPNSAGELVISVAPMVSKRSFTLGSARIALIVVLSLLMISGGVFLGAPTPYHALAS